MKAYTHQLINLKVQTCATYLYLRSFRAYVWYESRREDHNQRDKGPPVVQRQGAFAGGARKLDEGACSGYHKHYKEGDYLKILFKEYAGQLLPGRGGAQKLLIGPGFQKDEERYHEHKQENSNEFWYLTAT